MADRVDLARHMAGDGTWDHVLSLLHAQAEREGLIDWMVPVDSTIARAHQHAANIRRDIGRWIE